MLIFSLCFCAETIFFKRFRTIGKKIKESFDLSLLKEFSFEMNAKSIY